MQQADKDSTIDPTVMDGYIHPLGSRCIDDQAAYATGLSMGPSVDSKPNFCNPDILSQTFVESVIEGRVRGLLNANEFAWTPDYTSVALDPQTANSDRTKSTTSAT